MISSSVSALNTIAEPPSPLGKDLVKAIPRFANIIHGINRSVMRVVEGADPYRGLIKQTDKSKFENKP